MIRERCQEAIKRISYPESIGPRPGSIDDDVVVVTSFRRAVRIVSSTAENQQNIPDRIISTKLRIEIALVHIYIYSECIIKTGSILNRFIIGSEIILR